MVRFRKHFNEIVEHFGKSRFYKELPQLILYSDEKVHCYGQFDWEIPAIAVNVAMIPNTKTAVSTMLHEYCHYLQSPTWYTRYSSMYSYEKHPYEIQADKFAEQWLHKFYKPRR